MTDETGTRTYFPSRPVRAGTEWSAAAPAAPSQPAPPTRLQLRPAEPGRQSAASALDLGALLRHCRSVAPGCPAERPMPDAGSHASVEVLVWAYLVPGVRRGGYRYEPYRHSLSRVRNIEIGQLLETAPLGITESVANRPAAHAPATAAELPIPAAVVLAFVSSRTGLRTAHGARGHRYALLEAGQLTWTAMTTAAALGYLSQPWAAVSDSAIDSALGLDGANRSCQYLLSVC